MNKLLEKAKSLPPRTCKGEVKESDEVFELFVAYWKREITSTQIATVLFPDVPVTKGIQKMYNIQRYIIRHAFDKGFVKSKN